MLCSIWIVEINFLEDIDAFYAETQPIYGFVYRKESEYILDGKLLGEIIIYDDNIE